MTSRRMPLALGLLVSLTCAAAFAAPVKGFFTANGKKVALKYAYATTKKNSFDKKKTDTVLIVTDKEIPPEAVFDEFAQMNFPDQGISGFTIGIDPDKTLNSGTLFSPSFKKMHQFSSTGKQKLNLTTMTKDRIAGTVSLPADSFFDETYEYSATFDVPIQAKPVEKTMAQKVAELKGTPLPADGGDPAKAYNAYRKAISAGDISALRKSITADMVKQTEDPDFKKMLPVIQAMQAKKIKINGGSVDGDNATLLVTSLDEANTTGTVTMHKEGGSWKLVKEDWKTKSE